MAHEFVSHLFFQQEALPRAKQKVATARYLPVGGIDDIVVAAGPDDIEIEKMDVQASEEVPSKVLKDADALFFVFGEMLYLDAGLSRLHGSTV